MIIKFPSSVRFPVTITELLKQPNDDVKRMDALLLYTYKTTVTEYPEYGVEKQVEKVLSSQFDAPISGKIAQWLVKEGTVVKDNSVPIIEIEEPCTHEVQFAGLCTVCGEDMTLTDYNSYFSNSDRATIQLAHDNTGLKVSEDEARKLENDAKRRLLRERKLSLVVDLDQTIIHATVDPTVGEWKDDPFCVNHESVKDVAAFKLDEDVSGGRGTWYYVKMRPGLKEFLQHISKLFELHIYTMGTRAYALSVKKIVDPDGSLFGERVLSRDESGSMTQKSLHRLFPVDTKMVVIIDDRGDVWKWNDNLVKVRPYDFFVGIGDINSMFLPKKQEFPAAVPAAIAKTPEKPDGMAIEEKDEEEEGLGEDAADPTKAAGSTNLSTLEQLITMGSGSDQALITDQSSQLDKAIEAQKEARPLAKKQELQDRIDEEAAAAEAAATENGVIHKDVASDGGAHKHSVLQDNDWELTSLQNHLTRVHEQFYQEYEKNLTRKDRVSQLKDSKKLPEQDGVDLTAVPDVATIMPTMKRETLSGVVLVFSGVIPQGADIFSSDIARWAQSFGAKVVETVSSKVTHLIAARSRTAKVRTAARYPNIKIVSPAWLYDSISHWRHELEEPYLIAIHPEDRNPKINGFDGGGPLLSSEDEDSDEVEEEEEDFNTAELVDTSNVPWNDVHEEFAEYFGDEDFEESDTESMRSERTEVVEIGKRKREPGENAPADLEGDTTMDESSPISSTTVPSDTGSRLAKRQRIARERAAAGSGLRDVEISIHEEDDVESGSDSLADELERELLGLDEEEVEGGGG
ncbi:hypothetical protein FN846DRAFT_787193 [Sphaerosporella brunnea]|uniref:RNA polymerase II subunit A C-terminal domain phosphatase n=1 Tax=Sphaerosporella brunnea TaxID=1250544 RepID=A0A5J5EG93_9PEZI|nr:hypothetical protein FN846DRAFT_787193 [Sphaerosporella brunnea]